MARSLYPFTSEKRRPRLSDVRPILEDIADGSSLRAACRKIGVHCPSMHDLLGSTEDLREHYARARELRAEVLAEQALSLGVAAATGQSLEGRPIKPDGARVALDAIKWATARMAPKTAPTEKVHHTFEDLSDAALDAKIRAMTSKVPHGDDDADESGEGGTPGAVGGAGAPADPIDASLEPE